MTTDDSTGEVELKVCYSHGCDNRFEPSGGTFETRALCLECREAQEERRYTPQRPRSSSSTTSSTPTATGARATHMTVTVVNVRRDAYDVYAGRSRRYFPAGQTSRWGNPFVIGRHGFRNVVVAAYRLLLAVRIWRGEIPESDLLELDGSRVGCHCAPQPCHADVIADAVAAAVEDRLEEWAERVIEDSSAADRKIVEEHFKTTGR